MDQFIPEVDQSTGLCFVAPVDAIRVIFDSIGSDARMLLLTKAAEAWADEVPADEISLHYQKAVEALDQSDLEELAAWHSRQGLSNMLANKDFLIRAFPALDVNRRAALKLVAGMRSVEAVEAGLDQDDALELVLGTLSEQALMMLAAEIVGIYTQDRLGSDN